MCLIEEQDSSKTDELSADTSELSSTTSPTVNVRFQFCVIFTIKSQLGFVDGLSFIFTLLAYSNVTFNKDA